MIYVICSVFGFSIRLVTHFHGLSVLSISGIRLILLSSNILLVRMKTESDNTVEMGIDNTSHVNMESIGYVKEPRCRLQCVGRRFKTIMFWFEQIHI